MIGVLSRITTASNHKSLLKYHRGLGQEWHPHQISKYYLYLVYHLTGEMYSNTIHENVCEDSFSKINIFRPGVYSKTLASPPWHVNCAVTYTHEERCSCRMYVSLCKCHRMCAKLIYRCEKPGFSYLSREEK